MREFTKFFHLAMHVKDLQKSIKFYTDLGFDYMFTSKLPDGRDWMAYLRIAKNQYLELFQIYPDHPLTPREKIVTQEDTDFFGHYSFLVHDIYKAACEWKAKGYQVVMHPQIQRIIPLEDDSDIRSRIGADRNYICWLQDPDGNWIEVMEELDDSWQKVYEEKHPF